MNLPITTVSKHEYDSIIVLWEASVRATHHFIREEDILYYKPLIRNEYLKSVSLYAIRTAENTIAGFMGISGPNLEMLFIHPDHLRKGFGKILLQHGIVAMNVSKVEVNEENTEALHFYQKFGFNVVGRSETDSAGKKYPLLHLEL
ncbi:GNAT family N-acetyltransferase [Flavobacterium kingsejongi]|uniref:GNAT family N-acetyltransferase n=1 Tax=Flavobacterium kingsejongi TaxID=1678728 RepID=A0A2S1LKH3_9FLAO|nr:GNAT family N-acetyltransferase [Flavobacterium kingsejongi]AWG24263.1 GNAT family N-acetyltransferase [Flavobacterium kingsejongi]